MYPTKEDVIKMALEEGKAKKIRRIPICEEMLSDEFTTVEVLRTLQSQSRHCYLLESASQDKHWGRYSFLGFNPTMEIVLMDHDLRITTEEKDKTKNVTHTKVNHPKKEIKKILDAYKSPTIPNMPYFSGGLVGYFSYDYMKYSEPKLNLTSKTEDDFKDMDLMLFDQVIVFDHYRQKIMVIAGVLLGETNTMSPQQIAMEYDKTSQKIQEIMQFIKTGPKVKHEPLELETKLQPLFSKKRYEKMVEQAKKYIYEGDIFQVVLSNPLMAKAKGSLFDTYRMLRATNPSPYMFYFSSEDIEIAGASPETLAKLEGKKVFTFPLAGTRARGRNEAEDKVLEKELLADKKELAEHNMLVDLGRNDMGRISNIGSVVVDKYMEIEKFSQVMHIGSTIEGEIREDKDAMDVVDAILPAGTLSGAPKFRACQIIEELEGTKRGVYGGAIGYLDFTGNLDTCIAIRLVYKKKDMICIRSGAGIVADSVPEKEYEECQKKAKAVVVAMEKAKEELK